MQTLEPTDKLTYQFLPLYKQCEELIKVNEYKYVTAADAVAIAHQESSGVPVFHYEDPLFVANMGAAYEGSKLPKQMIWEAVLIKKGPFSGQISKFRFEPAYWEWSGTQRCNSLQLRLQMSCSFGLGQQMMRWIVPKGKPEDWTNFIENFKADTEMQLKYLLSNINKLLENNGNDLALAYAAYNSGNAHSKNLAVLARAQSVVSFRDTLAKEIS